MVPLFIQCNIMFTNKDTDKDHKTILCACGRAEPLRTRSGNFMFGDYMDKDFNRAAVVRKRVLTCISIN